MAWKRKIEGVTTLVITGGQSTPGREMRAESMDRLQREAARYLISRAQEEGYHVLTGEYQWSSARRAADGVYRYWKTFGGAKLLIKNLLKKVA